MIADRPDDLGPPARDGEFGRIRDHENTLTTGSKRGQSRGPSLTAAQIAGDIEKEAGKITTSSPEALKYYIEGRRLQENMENEKSIAHMERAVAIDPEFAMAYRSMGIAHQMLGHMAEARNYYKKALDLSDRLPENERLLIEAIWLDFGEENFAKAIEVLERLLKIYPGHILGNAWLAGSYYMAGNLDKAIEHMEFVKGRIQAEVKLFDEALKTAEELKSLIEKGINTKELRWYESILGLIELGKKNYRQAADLFGRACGRLDFINYYSQDAFEPAPYFDALARALYESGDLDKARKTYEKITLLTLGRINDGDRYAKAFYMLGKIAEQQGDKARVRENYRKFLDLWKDADSGLPEVENARKRLAGLKTP
jgi:tetratricopeptide (TPR) repeat protein